MGSFYVRYGVNSWCYMSTTALCTCTCILIYKLLPSSFSREFRASVISVAFMFSSCFSGWSLGKLWTLETDSNASYITFLALIVQLSSQVSIRLSINASRSIWSVDIRSGSWILNLCLSLRRPMSRVINFPVIVLIKLYSSSQSGSVCPRGLINQLRRLWCS